MKIKKNYYDRTKSELNKYYAIKFTSQPALKRQKASLEESLLDNLNITYDDMPHSKQAVSTRKEKIMDQINALDIQMKTNADYMKKLYALVLDMKPFNRDVLIHSFMVNKEKHKTSADDLAIQFNTSRRTIYRTRNCALDELTISLYGTDAYYKK